MSFSLPDLGFAYDALEPFIDTKTMKIHHSMHHQTYVDKLNAALVNFSDLKNKAVEELLIDWDTLPEEIQTPVRNHGGGVANHNLFWQILKKGTETQPGGKLSDALSEKFGSLDEFKQKFSDVAASHFGSGWAWLAWDAQDGLVLTSLPNQDSPLIHKQQPIFGLDVWEHAYYLKYQNRRAEYISAFWQILDWGKVSERFEKIAS